MKKQYVIILVILVLFILFIFCPRTKKLSVSYVPTKIENVQSLENATLNVYIENSGSMDGYTCQGSEFKDAIKGYVSSLESEFGEIGLYYINSQIIPISNNIKQFINNLTPKSFKQAGGSVKDTDMGKLIENVIKNTNDNTVSIFVSDCILDISKDDTAYFTDRQIDITSAVRRFIKNKNNSIEILQLKSRFDGYYYGLDCVQKLNCVRPYYIWIFGRNELLRHMNKISPIEDIKHGVQNWLSFSKFQPISFEIKNKFGQEAKNIVANNGVYNIIVNPNFNSLLKSDDLLSNPLNYTTTSKSVRIESVRSKSCKDQYTHVMTISIDDKIPSCAEVISFIEVNKIPKWVEDSNDDLGKNITANITKTTGFKYLIMGVAEAYKSERSLGTINFVIKNN